MLLKRLRGRQWKKFLSYWLLVKTLMRRGVITEGEGNNNPGSPLSSSSSRQVIQMKHTSDNHSLVVKTIKELHSLKQIRGPDPNYNDICFSGAGSDVAELSKAFPTVDMVFENKQKFSLSPENYLFRHSKVRGAYCLGVFQNGKDPTTLLGGIVVRNTFVTYDREHEKIGFWKTNCSELWERLNVTGAPPPEPSADNRPNSATIVPPAMAPTEPSHNVLPVVAKDSLEGLCIYMMVAIISFINSCTYQQY